MEGAARKQYASINECWRRVNCGYRELEYQRVMMTAEIVITCMSGEWS